MSNTPPPKKPPEAQVFIDAIARVREAAAATIAAADRMERHCLEAGLIAAPIDWNRKD